MSNWRVVPGATRYLVSTLGHIRRIDVYRDLAESPNRSGSSATSFASKRSVARAPRASSGPT